MKICPGEGYNIKIHVYINNTLALFHVDPILGMNMDYSRSETLLFKSPDAATCRFYFPSQREHQYGLFPYLPPSPSPLSLHNQ